MSERYPSLKECLEYFQNIPERCKCGEPYSPVSIEDSFVKGKCRKRLMSRYLGCDYTYADTFDRVNRYIEMTKNKEVDFSPEENVRVEGNNIFWKGKLITHWKANPDPFNPSVPRLHLTLEGYEKTNLTGHDASMVWTAIKKIEASRKSTGYQHSSISGGRATGVAPVSKVKDPNFDKIKDWKPGDAVLLRKKKGAWFCENMEFIVKSIGPTESTATLYPVVRNTILDPVKFTAKELCENFKIENNGDYLKEANLKKQGNQLLGRGPKVYCESQYE